MSTNHPAKTISPVTLLRLGLGFVFLYAGLHALVDPESWIGFVPQWVSVIIPATTFLIAHSIFELILGAVLLIGKWWLSPAAVVAAIDLAAIILFYGVDDVTFRDFGLVMAALAVFLLAQKNSNI
ncbi:MAG: hypothetical protein UW92_C0002G0018 [Candidatus Jorgensenbacteria bacterium GW2011_GWA2_45_13]|uniref:DoxX family protein n=1 Tax=Candidatus Jorgensenbacteria bacterium GW2011_GWA2_45_13 TaxID=1618662 RepID=A0A0G1P7L6_9BACT|nr:MAG: hypothetical protein UW92_C0002G0018 [Candidatus Jorgensenbacteria bacterium GW2011_GWA2_45_13]